MSGAIVIGEIRKNNRETLRVSLDEFKGHRLIDIRVFSAWGDDEDVKPTKKGVAFKVEKLGELIELLDKAAAEIARRA
jgi:hypothetical protein